MDENTKRQLDQLFARDAELKQKARERDDRARDERLEFVERFKQHREAVLEPALREFANYISANGWGAEVKITNAGVETGLVRSADRPSDAIKIEFYRGQKTHTGREPVFILTCHPESKKVNVFENTIGPNHGGSSGVSGSYTLDEMNYDHVHKLLAKYFTKLMNDSRPYDQRG